MRHLVLALALGWAFMPGLGLANHGPSDPNCGPSATVYERLEDRYEEKRVWRGLASDESIVELWARPDNDQSWTLIRTNAVGQSCIVASGIYSDELPDFFGKGT